MDLSGCALPLVPDSEHEYKSSLRPSKSWIVLISYPLSSKCVSFFTKELENGLESNLETEIDEVYFLDCKNKKRYNKKDTNTLVLCDSIFAILNGKNMKTFEITQKIFSLKFLTKWNKEFEKTIFSFSPLLMGIRYC